MLLRISFAVENKSYKLCYLLTMPNQKKLRVFYITYLPSRYSAVTKQRNILLW